MARASRVVVIGLDGLEPDIVDAMLQAGELPHLASIRASGGYSRVATTTPAQTPVAWSTFAIGVNPGGHGIFDFLRRDPQTYLPDLGLNRYEQKSAFLPPKVVNLRRGQPLWDVLSSAGISSTIIRCPCTYPPDSLRGRMLAGMGVPDIRGGLGTSTYYTTAADVVARESEQVVRLAGEGPAYRTRIIGPRHPKSRDDLACDVTLEVDEGRGTARIKSDGLPRALEVRLGEWSDWLHVKFKAGLLTSTAGILRFLLIRVTPHVELYASPVNFDPSAPLFPLSTPWEYASELAGKVGTFYTTGMVEDHTGLSNDRFGEAEYLAQCDEVMREREQMMLFELGRFKDGFFFCLFDTPDRVQHMFWRFRERGHPANGTDGDAYRDEFARVIEDHYRRCDATVGKALAAVDDGTLCIVLSDHGFGSFQRGVHLNSWLHANGFLALKPGVKPGPEAGELFGNVDWGHTRAYALGLGSIYLNVRGREREGIVAPDESGAVTQAIARGLSGLADPANGKAAIRGAKTVREVYRGPYASEAPDVIVAFAAGYRVSWATALGGIPAGLVEDNVKKWSGDHIIDPALVPGVLFMNRPFRAEGACLADLAPSILAALGAPRGERMEGTDLLAP